MISKRIATTARSWISLGVLALPMAAGCDQKGDTQTMAPPQSAAEQQSEAEARQKAFGPKGQPPVKGAPAAKPAEKSAAKPAEKPADEKK